MAAMQRGNCSVCGYLRHGLAQGVAEYLASVDGTLKAVYAYEPEYATSIDEPIGGGPSASPGISMILWVERKSAALSSVVNMLGLALGEEVRQLACQVQCHVPHA